MSHRPCCAGDHNRCPYPDTVCTCWCHFTPRTTDEPRPWPSVHAMTGTIVAVDWRGPHYPRQAVPGRDTWNGQPIPVDPWSVKRNDDGTWPSRPGTIRPVMWS